MAFSFLTAHECQCFKTLYMFQKPQYLSSRTGFSIIPPTRTATFLWWWSLCAPWMLGSRLVVLGEGPDRVLQRTLIRRKTKIPSILTGGSSPADGAMEPGGRAQAHGAWSGPAGSRDMGLPHCGLTTRRKNLRGLVLCGGKLAFGT